MGGEDTCGEAAASAAGDIARARGGVLREAERFC